MKKNGIWKNITFEKIPGGEVKVFDVYGSMKLHTIAPQEMPTLDARGRNILFLSDIHFFTINNEKAPTKKLKALLKILKAYPEAIVILGGDIYEMSRISPDDLRHMIHRGTKKKANINEKLFTEFHQNLRQINSILLPGNHDHVSWYQKSGLDKELTQAFFSKIRIRTDRGVFLAEHGHQNYKTVDEAKWKTIYKVPLFLRESFNFLENFALNVLGETFLKKIRTNINKRYKQALESVKKSYDVVGLIVGHSHVAEVDEMLQLYVNGIGQHGRIEYLFFHTDGLIEPRVEWYAKASEKVQHARDGIAKAGKKVFHFRKKLKKRKRIS